MAQYFDDFTANDIGTAPAGWTTRTNTLALEVVADAEATGGKALKIGPGLSLLYHSFVSFDAVTADANRADFEVLVRSRATNTNTGGQNLCGAAGRVFTTSTASSGFNGYTAGRRYSGWLDRLISTVSSGTLTILGTTAGTTVAAEVYAFGRFRVSGTTLQYRSWSGALEDEPATWEVETTNSTHSGAGWVGIWRNLLTNNVHVDFVGVGTGGDAAPSGPVGGGTALTILQALQANIASTGTTYADLSAGIATPAINNHDLSAAIATSGAVSNDLSSLVSTSGTGSQDLQASIATSATLHQALRAAIATEIQTSADLLLTVSELVGTVVNQDLRLSIATAQTGHADLQTSIATLAEIRQGLQLAVATSLTTLHDTSIQIAELIGTIVRQDLQLVIASELQQAQAVALSVASQVSTAQATLAAVATEQTITVPLTVAVSTLLESLADLELRIESITTSTVHQELRLEIATEMALLQGLLVRVQDAANVLMPELFSAVSRVNTTFSAVSRVETAFSAVSRIDLRRLS